MAKAEERTYDAAPGRVYSAAIKAIADLGYSVRSSDSQSRIVSFNTGMSWRSWSGQDMTVSVIEQAGGTRVTLTGGLAKKGTVITGGQLVAWGEKGAVSRRFLEAFDGPWRARQTWTTRDRGVMAQQQSYSASPSCTEAVRSRTPSSRRRRPKSSGPN